MADPKTLDALFTTPKRRIICALFGEPDRWWSLPDLAHSVAMQPGSLRLHLKALRDGGLLREQHDGKTWLFQPDPASPIFLELRSIVAKLTSITGSETIMVVEDQHATARITCILLESWGYTVLEAHGANEAMGLFDSHAPKIRLLLTDIHMPEMSGPQLAALLRRRDPGLRVIYMSGYATDENGYPGIPFLAKPFNPASLSRIVREELDRPVVIERPMNSALD